MKRLIIIILAYYFILNISCSKYEDTKKDYGDWLIIGVLNKFSNLNPFEEISSASSVVCDLIFDGLIDINEKGEILPAIAESWSVSDDGKEYIFRIRKGVLFHDGH